MDYTESHLHVCQCLVATVNDFEMSMIEYDDDLEIWLCLYSAPDNGENSQRDLLNGSHSLIESDFLARSILIKSACNRFTKSWNSQPGCPLLNLKLTGCWWPKKTFTHILSLKTISKTCVHVLKAALHHQQTSWHWWMRANMLTCVFWRYSGQVLHFRTSVLHITIYHHITSVLQMTIYQQDEFEDDTKKSCL